MEHSDIEQRLARIEAQIADLGDKLIKLDERSVRGWEGRAVRHLKLDLRVQEVEAVLKDFREVERIAQEAYFKTHPDALTSLREVNDAVETARAQHYFSTLPTIKERKDLDSGSKS